MTEDDARSWLGRQFGLPAVDRLSAFADLVQAEASRQNLIAASTLGSMWSRHLLDSGQLVPLAPTDGLWLDIGTGAGFPGLVVAILRNAQAILVEPRRRRAEFLVAAARALGLSNVEVRATKVENVAVTAAVISARAVAPTEKLLRAADGCATMSTRWLLPKGKVHAGELAALRRNWAGAFHVKQSLSDEPSSILIADGVRFKGRPST